MNTEPLNNTFDPQTLADDLMEVHRIYTNFFAGLNEADWDKPVKGWPKEWNQHETVAHLCALNGDGLESIKATLRSETFTFKGLESRYQFNAWNRAGINRYLALPREELCEKALNILKVSASIARSLTPEHAKLTARMPIYNRPVGILEALGIISFHTGLSHTTQVSESSGVSPLWTQLSPEIRHRIIGRVMRAFSLLYRLDIGGQLHTSIVFRVEGPGGGEWHVDLSPDAPCSAEGFVEHPELVIQLRKTDVFCQMLTGRLNLPLALINGDLKLHNDLRLFFRMSNLLSIDAKPKLEGKNLSFQKNRTSSPS